MIAIYKFGNKKIKMNSQLDNAKISSGVILL